MVVGSERIFLLLGKVCLELIVEKGIGYAADGYMVISLRFIYVVWDNADFWGKSVTDFMYIPFFLLFRLHKHYLCFDKQSLKMQHHLRDSWDLRNPVVVIASFISISY